MIKDYLEIGQIVGTHGVRGELRENSGCVSVTLSECHRHVDFSKGSVTVSRGAFARSVRSAYGVGFPRPGLLQAGRTTLAQEEM